MARKQPNLDNLFKKTEPQPETEEAAPQPQQAERSAPAAREVDRTLPVGVGLKASELAKLDAIAAELGIARNALLRFAVAHFLQDYKAGRVTVDVETKETRRVVMPK